MHFFQKIRRDVLVKPSNASLSVPPIKIEWVSAFEDKGEYIRTASQHNDQHGLKSVWMDLCHRGAGFRPGRPRPKVKSTGGRAILREEPAKNILGEDPTKKILGKKTPPKNNGGRTQKQNCAFFQTS